LENVAYVWKNQLIEWLMTGIFVEVQIIFGEALNKNNRLNEIYLKIKINIYL
jgi:hypothetical protein